MSSASLPNYFVTKSSDGKLFRNVLNEILNGFAIDNFEITIGFTRSELEKLFEYFDRLPGDAQVQLTRAQAWAAYKALGETLRELGNEEFHTRTGFNLAEGESVLKRLDRFLQESE